MNTARLIARNLLWFRRTNLAVVGGVAVAVAVIAGALVVGDSVHASLRAIALERIGNTERIVTAAYPFREQLAARLGGAPLVAADGIVIHQTSGRRASGVRIYGVDDRFWRFHGRPARGPAGRDVLLSQPLARELAAEESDAILLRLERHSDIPRESLHGRKEETARTLRSTMRAALTAAALGEF